ncbi:MAG: hypothetical protein JWP79_1279, partial [Polaromonas sp.]|nr:hypothetical protein [Polaromonas sp.]
SPAPDDILMICLAWAPFGYARVAVRDGKNDCCRQAVLISTIKG